MPAGRSAHDDGETAADEDATGDEDDVEAEVDSSGHFPSAASASLSELRGRPQNTT